MKGLLGTLPINLTCLIRKGKFSVGLGRTQANTKADQTSQLEVWLSEKQDVLP